MNIDQLEEELRTLFVGIIEHKFKGLALDPETKLKAASAVIVALVNTGLLTAAECNMPPTDFTWMLRDMASGFDQAVVALTQSRMAEAVGPVTDEDRARASEMEKEAVAALDNLEGKALQDPDAPETKR